MDINWLTFSDEEQGKTLISCSSDAFGEILIPNDVKCISSFAFDRCTQVSKIVIPESVVAIKDQGGNPFYLCQEVVVSDDNIVYDSRQGCNALIEKATSTLVYGCNNSVIPDSILRIGKRAFEYCRNMEDISIPESVTEIGEKAFHCCSGLKNLKLPNSIKIIEKFAFDHCTSIKRFTLPNMLSVISAGLFYCCTGLEDVIIPKSVTAIERAAFAYCPNLKTINIPNSVIEIMDAFGEGCGLESITLPASLSGIKPFTFCQTYNLKTISVDKDNPVFDSRDNCNAIIETKTNKLVAGCLNSTIPSSVKVIGSNAFLRCEKLTHIEIPEGVSVIESGAFSSCRKLAKLQLPDTVKKIGAGAFNYCPKVRSIIEKRFIIPKRDWEDYILKES